MMNKPTLAAASRAPFLVLLALLAFTSGAAAARNLPDFADLAERVGPAVVNIGTRLKAGSGPGMPPGLQMPDIPEDNPLHDFFKKFFGDGGPGGNEPQSSLGSGFIISADGYVISNYHVVRDAEEIIVRLTDRREFLAEVVGTDERSDLAVLKIEATGLPVVKLGDSTRLRVGEWVLAIGAPFGFEQTVTAGIVSAKGRSLPNENYTPFIQTDVAINPGNSGGPLFNLDGEVIGVNSQIFSRTGGFMGLSFAIPMEVANNVYQQLRSDGRVTRGWLGVLIQDVTRELAESFGMSKPHGALVSKVLPDSPAEAAGFQPGDIVVRFGGREIDLSADLPPVVGNTPVGRESTVDIIRNGEPTTLTVRIGELPSQDALAVNAAGGPGDSRNTRLNITVAELSPEQREELQLGDQGVLVESVEEGPASRAGIRPGDVIVLIDNRKVGSVQQLGEILATLEAGKSVPVLVQRRGGPMFLAIRLPEE